jgi:hypothetical protein
MSATVTFEAKGSFVVSNGDGRDFRFDTGTHTVPAALWARIEQLLPVALASADIRRIEVKGQKPAAAIDAESTVELPVSPAASRRRK